MHHSLAVCPDPEATIRAATQAVLSRRADPHDWDTGKESVLLADVQVERFQRRAMELLQVLISDTNGILQTELLQPVDKHLSNNV